MVKYGKMANMDHLWPSHFSYVFSWNRDTPLLGIPSSTAKIPGLRTGPWMPLTSLVRWAWQALAALAALNGDGELNKLAGEKNSPKCWNFVPANCGSEMVRQYQCRLYNIIYKYVQYKYPTTKNITDVTEKNAFCSPQIKDQPGAPNNCVIGSCLWILAGWAFRPMFFRATVQFFLAGFIHKHHGKWSHGKTMESEACWKSAVRGSSIPQNSSKFVRFNGDDDENSSHPLGVDQWIWMYCNKVPRGKSNNVKGSGGAYWYKIRCGPKLGWLSMVFTPL